MTAAPSDPAPCFERRGEQLLPTARVRGPWSPSVSGVFVGGILAQELEQRHRSVELLPVRFTVELLRPLAMAPFTLASAVIRDGRLRVADVMAIQDDRLVARATAVFARPGADPAPPWTADLSYPSPPEAPPTTAPMWLWAGTVDAVDADPAGSPDLSQWRRPGPNFGWLRFGRNLLEGIDLTPFVRVAMAGDVSSSLTHHGPDELHYINTDYSIALGRLPVGDFIGLLATDQAGSAGAGAGAATLVDADGAFGFVTVSTLAAGAAASVTEAAMTGNAAGSGS